MPASKEGVVLDDQWSLAKVLKSIGGNPPAADAEQLKPLAGSSLPLGFSGGTRARDTALVGAEGNPGKCRDSWLYYPS